MDTVWRIKVKSSVATQFMLSITVNGYMIRIILIRHQNLVQDKNQLALFGYND